MDLQLKKKVALVTGSTAGIGLAIARALHAEGATVILNGRTERRVAEAVASLSDGAADGAERLRGWAGDLASPEGAAALASAHPAVDILVNNLGIFESKPASEIKEQDFEVMFTVNVLSGARLARIYLPAMRARGFGRVVFISSETGVNVPADMIPYGVSKAAQIALARGLAETTAGTSVTVNTVLPGPTLTEGVDQFLSDLPLAHGRDRASVEAEFLQQLRPTSLLKRFAAPEEVASLVTYLASPLSSATNGAALRVEGGLLRGIL